MLWPIHIGNAPSPNRERRTECQAREETQNAQRPDILAKPSAHRENGAEGHGDEVHDVATVRLGHWGRNEGAETEGKDVQCEGQESNSGRDAEGGFDDGEGGRVD